jgi:D-alanyl-D-alanine carboxypeptidase
VATLRQLLSHTSGLGQTYTDDRDRGRVLSTKDLLNRIPRPVCDPGKCFSYADGNYVLAGLVLEAASRHDLADELNARLLGPLDLNDTELPDVGASIPTQYALVTDDRGDPVAPHRVREQLLPLSGRNPAGGMIATAGDVARWASQLFGGRVLEPSSLRTLLDTGVSRGLPCPRGCPFPYSLGVYHYNIDGRELIGHDGSSGAVVVYDHERHITVAILTNGGESDTGAFLRQVLRAVAE